MPEKKTLLQGEFAINKAAIFNLDAANRPEIIVNNDGTMSITLHYNLQDPVNNLQSNEEANEEDIKFQFCGVFNTALPNTFADSSALTLTVDATELITLMPVKKALVTTLAVKGRQGNTIIHFRKKSKKSE